MFVKGEAGEAKAGELAARAKAGEAMVFDKPVNFITAPIRRDKPDGFLILQVYDRRAPGIASLEEVEGQTYNQLYSMKFQPAVRVYLTQLRRRSTIHVKNGYVDRGAVPHPATEAPR